MSGYQLEPYINFKNGACAQALAFYTQVFGGAVTFQMTFADAPASGAHPIPEAEKAWVMHANFKADGLNFMASDCPSAFEFVQGNNVHLSLNFQSAD